MLTCYNKNVNSMTFELCENDVKQVKSNLHLSEHGVVLVNNYIFFVKTEYKCA